MRAILFTVPLAFAATAATLMLTAAPAMAAADACGAAPDKLRAIAATTDAATQAKAVRNINMGEALCEARNKVDAAKKFNLAAKALGTDLATVMAGEKVAAVQ